MIDPLALHRGSHYLENGLRLALLADVAYRSDPAVELARLGGTYRRLESFQKSGTFGFVVSTEQNLVIALRGTDQVVDWITNLKTAQTRGFGGSVHRGFAEALDEVWDDIWARVETLHDHGQTIWITGHSLGGALATLVAARLTERELEPHFTCTFGAPRVFSPAAASRYLPRLYRFVNKGDLIPAVPPCLTLPWYLYRHASSLTVILDKDRSAALDAPPREERFPLLTWLVSSKSAWIANVTQRLTDHSLKSYIQLIREELGAETVQRMEEDRPAVLPFVARIKPRRSAKAA